MFYKTPGEVFKDTFKATVSFDPNDKTYQKILSNYTKSFKPWTPKPSFEIEKVIFNEPATIVIWKDGEKTVVKCQEGDAFDPEKGLAMAISKRALGNKGNFNNVFRRWTSDYIYSDLLPDVRLTFDDVAKAVRNLFGAGEDG